MKFQCWKESKQRMCRDTKSLFSIGKGTDNDFVIDNKAVSRRHAVVQIQNGDYFLIDKESTNFKYLNGSRLEKSSI